MRSISLFWCSRQLCHLFWIRLLIVVQQIPYYALLILSDLDKPVVGVSPASPKEGDDITLTCQGTSNGGTMTYTWYHNDAVITGAARKTYVVLNGTKSNNGNYHCAINTTAFTKVSEKMMITLTCELI